MKKNTALELMLKVNSLKQRKKDLQAVAITFLKENKPNSKLMYLGLMKEAEKVELQIFSICSMLAKVGIDYE